MNLSLNLYDDDEDEKFQGAIEGTEQGMVVKNYQTNATLYKRVGEEYQAKSRN